MIYRTVVVSHFHYFSFSKNSNTVAEAETTSFCFMSTIQNEHRWESEISKVYMWNFIELLTFCWLGLKTVYRNITFYAEIPLKSIRNLVTFCLSS